MKELSKHTMDNELNIYVFEWPAGEGENHAAATINREIIKAWVKWHN